MRILFKAKNFITYHSLVLDCFVPGEYEVDEEKARQLVTDFPEDFEIIEQAPNKEVETDTIRQKRGRGR
jgi:hypothetical protein